MSPTRWLAEDVRSEFSGVNLGDPRRRKRLQEISFRLARDPQASFPEAFHEQADQEGFYRFVRNEAFGWEDIFSGHSESSVERAEQWGECLCLHDTTEFSFSGDRAGLEPTSAKAKGFFAHVGLLVGADEARTPLGVVALEQYVRQRKTGKRRQSTEVRANGTEESRRWDRNIATVEQARRGKFECIHVADREADALRLLSQLAQQEARFVVRVCRDRILEDEFGDTERLGEVLARLEPVVSYDISISPRGKRLNPTMAKSHPSRRERTAHVSLASRSIVVAAGPKEPLSCAVELNAVRVWESTPPPGEPAVDWILWTSEPVDTVEQIRRVVDIYRTRWVIEEYFKALKTGCRFEQRQLESLKTLSMALAVFLPIAWKLLLMRSVARHQESATADRVVNTIQKRYLETQLKREIRTTRDALAAVAQLGGHIRRNGEPGWQTLGKGWEKLLTGEAFYRVMTEPPDL